MINSVDEFIEGKIYKLVFDGDDHFYFKFKNIKESVYLDFYWEICSDKFGYKNEKDLVLYHFIPLLKNRYFEEVNIEEIKHLLPQQEICLIRKKKIKRLLWK